MSRTDNHLGTLMPGMMADCTRMDRRTIDRSDGQFGTVDAYEPGAAFRAMLIKVSAPEVRLAERQGLREQYTVVVPMGVALRHNDVFRRDSDGRTFRVTSSTTDGAAPEASTVKIAKCSAERWDIPEGGQT